MPNTNLHVLKIKLNFSEIELPQTPVGETGQNPSTTDILLQSLVKKLYEQVAQMNLQTKRIAALENSRDTRRPDRSGCYKCGDPAHFKRLSPVGEV